MSSYFLSNLRQLDADARSESELDPVSMATLRLDFDEAEALAHQINNDSALAVALQIVDQVATLNAICGEMESELLAAKIEAEFTEDAVKIDIIERDTPWLSVKKRKGRQNRVSIIFNMTVHFN